MVIFSEQNLTAIIVSLAVWKSGKLLIAVDPSPATEQLVTMVKDVEAILTTNENLTLALALANKTTVKVINSDSLENNLLDEDMQLSIHRETPADIRYSSGSTGRPKGIVRNHWRLLADARSNTNLAHICPDDRLVGLTTLSYGSRDLLYCFLSGAALFPFDVKKHAIAKLVQLLNDEKITYYHSVSSIFRSVVAELDGTVGFPSMCLIALGGELLFRSDIESYKKYFLDECILMNRLSADEAGNLCTLFINKNTAVDTSIVPVGYPAEGKRVVLLDEQGEQIGDNEVGEIAIRGQHLSLGYWNNPDLTEAKFRTDPVTGETIYLTGDLGKVLPEGRLLYVGRKDTEVKIRGIQS